MCLHAKAAYMYHESYLQQQMQIFLQPVHNVKHWDAIKNHFFNADVHNWKAKSLAFAKMLHDLMSLVYPVSCRNGNVTLEICYTIPVKYAFCRKKAKVPAHMESTDSFSIIVKPIRVSCLNLSFKNCEIKVGKGPVSLQRLLKQSNKRKAKIK